MSLGLKLIPVASAAAGYRAPLSPHHPQRQGHSPPAGTWATARPAVAGERQGPRRPSVTPANSHPRTPHGTIPGNLRCTSVLLQARPPSVLLAPQTPGSESDAITVTRCFPGGQHVRHSSVPKGWSDFQRPEEAPGGPYEATPQVAAAHVPIRSLPWGHSCRHRAWPRRRHASSAPSGRKHRGNLPRRQWRTRR